MTLYENIKKRREELKMSQEELARRMGYVAPQHSCNCILHENSAKSTFLFVLFVSKILHFQLLLVKLLVSPIQI